MKSGRWKIYLWDFLTIFWIAIAGSALHFAFELSDYWRPLAFLAAVNESLWEHTKMYFWPGLLAALVQYTYTRDIANNYWLGKATALVLTPAVIFVSFFAYTGWAETNGVRPALAAMLGIMFFGIAAGQFASSIILTRPPLPSFTQRYALAGGAVTVLLFSTLTFNAPRMKLFENYFCYQYTGEYGILADYEPYRVFVRRAQDGTEQQGGGVNYCANSRIASALLPKTATN